MGTIDPDVRPGRGFFRHRGWIPLLVLGPLVAVTAFTPARVVSPAVAKAWAAAGFALGIVGLTIRAVAIGWAAPGTSGRATRVLRADALTTDGAYSLVRHPLYLGSYLLWLGVTAFTVRPPLLLFTTGAFIAAYLPIVRAEEAYLQDRFGAAFRAWAARTGPFFPRRWRWVAPERPYSLHAVLTREHHALLAFVMSTWAVATARSAALGSGAPSALGWWTYLACGSVLFLALDVRARRSRRRR